MTRAAVAAAIVSVLAAAAEVWLAFRTLPAGPPAVLLGAFLAGPLLFVALLAWKRRTRPGRSRLLLGLAVVGAAAGLAVLAADAARQARGAGPLLPNPVLLPLGQWVVVLAVWGGLVVAEGREARSAGNTP